MKNNNMLTSIENEISDLKFRAAQIQYKNAIPTLGEYFKEKPEWLQKSLLVGFRKRFSNWKQGLLIQENPGGFETIKKESTISEISPVDTAILAEKFNGSAV